MVSFESDYIAGAHPEIIRRLTETNLECLSGYGADPYTGSARKKIREAVGLPDADVEFVVGGTQTNALIISTMPYTPSLPLQYQFLLYNKYTFTCPLCKVK